MDISTGRCPTKKQGCNCKNVCAALYGQEVKRLRKEALSASSSQREAKYKAWQDFIKKYSHKVFKHSVECFLFCLFYSLQTLKNNEEMTVY
jgi:hypothetical protein